MSDLSESGRFGPDVRWPQRLQKFAGPAWHIIEEGLPGRTTVHDDPIEGAFLNGMSFLPAVLRSHRPVDQIIVMLGTNDLKARFCVGAGDIALSLGRIADVITQSGAGPDGNSPGLLFICPPPITETGCLADMFTGGAAKSVQMQRLIPEYLAQSGLAVIRAADCLSVSDADGIHYTAQAHLALAEMLAGQLEF